MTKYYLTTPFCETFTSREEAVSDIVDAFCSSDEADADFTAYYNSDAESDADRISDASEAYSCFEEWATYEAYDLLDKAERCGRSAAYGVTVYANAKAAALEERASDAFDPWAGPDARVALFCAIFNGGEELDWLLEQLHDLAHDVGPDEAEKILALIADISRFDGERRPS